MKSKIPKGAVLLIPEPEDENAPAPHGIPPAVPWEELEKKMKVPKQAKNVRGKLNVPRERFRLRESGYVWAGK